MTTSFDHHDAQFTGQSEHMMFAFFLALIFHGVIIFGISFDYIKKQHFNKTLEVTLAHYQSETKLSEADFLAQIDQEGSGTAKDALMQSTIDHSDFQDQQYKEIREKINQASASNEPFRRQVITTKFNTELNISNNISESLLEDAFSSGGDWQAPTDASTDISSFDATLDTSINIQAKETLNVHKIQTASTMSASDAAYIHSWLEKIEQYGNKHYPERARQFKIYGNVMIRVAIKPNGQLEDVSIVNSSGYKILDDSAIRIVKMAAPYAPFPPEISSDVDIIEIVRVWQFRKNNSLKTRGDK